VFHIFVTEYALIFLSDISGNVRALNYALNHPLVFHDSQVRLDQKQKPYNSLSRVSLFCDLCFLTLQVSSAAIDEVYINQPRQSSRVSVV
jgi:hypothetical protein